MASGTDLTPVDEAEPNDTRLTATDIPLTEDPSGSEYSVGFGVRRQDPAPYQNHWSDPDCWRIELLAGDIINVSVDTPGSGVDPYVELHGGADQWLTADNNAGPDADALISHYVVPVSGSYYVLVGKDYWGNEAGGYELRVDVARGIQLESDANYQNDSIGGANPLTLASAGTHQVATVAGCAHAPDSHVPKRAGIPFGIQMSDLIH